MTRSVRALIGAALGAALTLLLHPASRPYVFSPFVSPIPRFSPPQKEIPRKLDDLADWMTAVGDRFVSRNRLTPLELKNAVAAAEVGAELEPRNAYWRQMLACLYHNLGDEAEAKNQWSIASNCDVWYDYQSDLLIKERDRLAQDFGAKQSWQLAYVYFLRNKDAVLLISAYSRAVLASSPMTTDSGMLLRAATVQNGSKLLKGSRSIRIGDYGAEMSELACHTSDIGQTPNHHQLFLQRVKMQSRLRELGHSLLAEQVHKSYNEADAWYALANHEEAEQVVNECSYLSLLYGGTPGTLLVVGLIGLCLWLLGNSFRKVEKIHTAHAAIAGTILAAAVYWITLLPLAAVATLLCCGFLMLGPKRERRLKVDDLGPMFSFAVGALGLSFMLLLGAFIVGAGSPAVSILPSLNVPREYFGGSGVLLGLAIIVIALLLLLAPLFATALRVGTSFVLSTGLKKFGAFLGYLSLALFVLTTPLCIYFDRKNSEILEHLVTNEPVYYYVKLPR